MFEATQTFEEYYYASELIYNSDLQEEWAINQSEFKQEKSFAMIDIKLDTDSLSTEQIEVLLTSEVFGYSFESVFDRQTELQLRNLKIGNQIDYEELQLL